MPLLPGIGVLGGLLRDLAPNPDEIWRFSLLPTSASTASSRKAKIYQPRLTSISVSLPDCWWPKRWRRGMAKVAEKDVFLLIPAASDLPALAAVYLATVFTVFVPLKIWNSARNEKKLEEQERLLSEARTGGADQPD